MLSPAKPDKQDPHYEEKMRVYRNARKHQRRHPEAWGMRLGNTGFAPSGKDDSGSAESPRKPQNTT